DHVAKFMKRYAAAKGHGIRISGSGKIYKMTNEIIKRRYLCRHAEKAIFKQTTQSNMSSC
ncbi:6795_t:CDS:1, partial [Funneliformis mosseae]